ncbi:hypothetical protein SERLA73DRAFT_76289 [Serpula lacrymans var. lacrymans S7.3]|uniref:Cerato-platanin n=2 Tax=Serpula lacrymans var. lacrymans TaxID=341189 RepID=F8Q6S4_SERL3|nr:uncharacterized protein SERLADRAFT_441081 [Serpula lacrymans var. lacrymans S7.9]EGN96312.1 hypothetical protein SERLA73DRAFT_76289 [Serpula lacrymans var. lacrymans S7.3]EGO21849.1 hypothetical protein SERLADRAFT_441081 [Serpula lacrymans var. lacrymans S7.9]
MPRSNRLTSRDEVRYVQTEEFGRHELGLVRILTRERLSNGFFCPVLETPAGSESLQAAFTISTPNHFPIRTLTSIMKFTSVLTSLALLALPSLSSAYYLTYDETYDNAALSLDYVACSDGVNGLISKGYTTLGSLPTFPNVGGVFAVTGWDSTACGSCWDVTYTSPTGTTNLLVTAVDTGADGFNLSLEAMNTLTNGEAVFLGNVTVTATEVAPSQCGL